MNENGIYFYCPFGIEMRCRNKSTKQLRTKKYEVRTCCSQLIFAAMRILMVCLGNICRSPLAEGVLQHKAWKAGLQWSVESAGTGAWHAGEPPHHLSIKVAKHNGVDISKQRARQFVKEDFLNYDFIYVMDSSNYIDVKKMSGKLWKEDKVDLLLNELYPSENRAVPDPWYGKEEGYHTVYEMIDKACDKIIEKYKQEVRATK